MESKGSLASPIPAAEITSLIYGDEGLRDGSNELERARGEFRLGHLDAATKLLDSLARRLENRTLDLNLTAIYAASRVLDARIHEEQKLPGERDKALADAMAIFESISDDLEKISNRSLGDYGVALEMLGRHQEAAQWLTKARDKGLDTQPTFRYLGLAQKAMGQWKDAAESLAEAGKRNPEDSVAFEALGDVLTRLDDRNGAAEAYWNACVIHLRRAESDDSLRLIRMCVGLRAENAKDLGLYGAVLWKRCEYPQALEMIDRAIELAPPNVKVLGQNLMAGLWRMKGRVLLSMERWQDAEAAFSKAIIEDPDNSIALAGRAKALTQLGRAEEALAQLDDALTREPKNVAFLVDKVDILCRLGKLEQAAQIAEEARSLDHSSVLPLQARAAVHQLLKHFDEAARDFEAILEMAPANADAWLGLAAALRDAGRTQETLDVLRKAVTYPVDFSAADTPRLWMAFGCALREQGRLHEAREAIDKSYSQNPTLSGVLNLIDVLRQLQEFERAFELVDEYMTRQVPIPDEILARKASLLCDVGEFEQAYEILRPIEAKDAYVFTVRGWALALENRGPDYRQRALAEFEQAIELEPTNLWYKNYKAGVLRLLHRKEEADQLYSEIAAELTKRSASLDAYGLWLLGWCYLCLGNCGEAVRYLKAVPSTETAAFPQFDLALAFLCDGRAGLAERSYTDSVNLAQERSRMRQRTLLTVALRDLDASWQLGQIPSEFKETYQSIRALLQTALNNVPRYAYQASQPIGV